MNLTLIIPTLNAAESIQRLLTAVHRQTMVPTEILIVDSQSEDSTLSLASQFPSVRCITIPKNEFDHGGTRDMALRKSSGDIVLFMTQDALPADEYYVEHLIAPFEDTRVAAVGGRQIAYPDARPFEKLVRANNYPAQSRTWGAEDIERLGVRAFLISDVCAAYRREAYLAVGGFDHPIMTNEDMLMAERLLHAGYRVAYQGDACVFHSHNFTLKQEYRRNLLIGKTLKRHEARFDHVHEMSTGTALAKTVLLELIKEKHFAECFCFAANCAARLLGNKVGRWQEAHREKTHE